MKRRISWILIALICLSFLFCTSFYMFATSVDSLSDKSIKNQLQEATNNNYTNAKALMDKDQNQLTGLAYRLATSADINQKEEVRNILNAVGGYTSYDYLIIYTPQFAYSNDDSISFKPNENVLESFKTEDAVLTAIGDDQSVGFAVPIYQDDQVIGALQGVYAKETLADLLHFTLFEDHGHFAILDKTGDYLFHSGKVTATETHVNLFDSLHDSAFSEPYSLEEIHNKIDKNKSFYSRYSYQDDKQIAYFVPLNIGDWYLMSAVPESYLARFTNQIDLYALWLMMVMALVFLSLIVVIALLNRRDKKILKDRTDDLERLMNTIPLPIFVIDKNRRISSMNQGASTIFGVDKDDLIGKPCCHLKTNICDTHSCAIRMLEEKNEMNVFMEIGESRFLVSTTRYFDENNQHTGYVEVLQNITELMNVQKILEARTLELETISQNLLAGVLITTLDEGFEILQCNQGYLDLVGHKESDVVGKSAVTWLMKEDIQAIEENIFTQLKTSETVSLEHRLNKENGEQIWVFLYGRKAILHEKEVGIWLVMNIDERKRAEQSVKLSEEKYRIAADNTENIVLDYDIEKDVMIQNEKILDLYDIEMEVSHPTEKLVSAGIIAKTSYKDFVAMFQQLQAGAKKVEADLLTFSKDKKELWQRVIFTTIFSDEGKPLRAIGVLRDITSEKNVLIQYQREAQYRKVTLEDATLYYEADLTNKVFITGHEELTKQFLAEPTDDFDVVVDLMIKYLVLKDDRDYVRNHIAWENLMSSFDRGETKLEFDYQRFLSNQECGWVRCTIHLYEDETTQNRKVIAVIKDIDESKKQELYLMKQAQIDLLTGLYNKMTTEKLIERYISDAQDGQLGALLIVDLDDFKNINDTFGHAFGDAVLSEVSQQLIALFGSHHIAGRIGGDEFIVFLKDLAMVDDAERWARDVCSLFHNSYTERNKYKLSGSVGIACYPSDGVTFEELYERADIALYSAKNGGKDSYCLYDVSLPQIRSDELMRAIDANAGKQFSENISEYVLQILYEAKNPEMLVEAVLELVSKQFHFSRGYVFIHDEEKRYWTNVYEWCANGIPSQKETFSKADFGAPGYYESHFNEDGEFYRQNAKDLSNMLYKTILQLKVQSFVQFAIKRGDEIVAFVGFDDCVETRIFTKEMMSILHTVSTLLDVFVFQKTFK